MTRKVQQGELEKGSINALSTPFHNSLHVLNQKKTTTTTKKTKERK